jgi:hypothetical protein
MRPAPFAPRTPADALLHPSAPPTTNRAGAIDAFASIVLSPKTKASFDDNLRRLACPVLLCYGQADPWVVPMWGQVGGAFNTRSRGAPVPEHAPFRLQRRRRSAARACSQARWLWVDAPQHPLVHVANPSQRFKRAVPHAAYYELAEVGHVSHGGCHPVRVTRGGAGGP